MEMDVASMMEAMAALSAEERTLEENNAFRQRLLASFIVLLLMSGLIIGLRLYAKFRVIRNLGLEDLAAFFAYVRSGDLLCH